MHTIELLTETEVGLFQSYMAILFWIAEVIGGTSVVTAFNQA